MIQDEVFNYLFAKATHKNRRARYERSRYNRALLALSCQNYFFGANFTNTTGAAGVLSTSQTLPVNRPVLVRGGGMNAQTLPIIIDATAPDPVLGAVNLQIFRSGTGRAQMCLNPLRSCAWLSDGQGQFWELDWPTPIRLQPNEVLQVKWQQITAVDPGTIYAINFYGVAVDPNMQCDPDILESVCEQIRNTDMRSLYVNIKGGDSGGTINFGAIGANQIKLALTDKAPEHLLVLGFKRNDSTYLQRDTTFRLSSGDGHSFSREELTIKGFEYFNKPDAGWFKFTVPHFLREGQSLNAQFTSDTTTTRDQLEGEINLVCVTV